ncbi:hypothetical protein Vadar_008928 [Vaccinium darrowii]|uniref:Uncharacterized protein n=1 Tax=Vaccinium darrowii TaxID=229202 RepID=A0ACB7ZJ94_9ERIC|nr:hypothetical protein Vadar_008928 [Vaccinium darrowii]
MTIQSKAGSLFIGTKTWKIFSVVDFEGILCYYSIKAQVMFAHPYFDLIFYFKGILCHCNNVDLEMYSYMDMLQDVNETVVSKMPSNIGAAITVVYEFPGTGYRIELGSDKADMDLFSMKGVPPKLNLFVEVETPVATVYPDVGDGSDVEELSDYQSRDDEGRYSSDGEAKIESKGKGVAATSSYGKEPYVDGEGEVVLERHMIFEDVNAFRAKLRDYTVEKGFKIVRDKNEDARVIAHCAALGCKWRIHASPMFDGITYQIKSLPNEHTCIRHNQNDEATSTWISKKLLQSFKENPQLTLDAMQEKLHSKYGLEASHSQLYRAKRKCQDVLEGNHGEQYNLLPTYAMEVRKTNPGSLFKMQYDRPSLTVNPIFQRLFVCFEAMKAGFLNGCRPFLGVVEVECKESWGFFFSNLQTIIGSTNIKKQTLNVAKIARDCQVQFCGGEEYEVKDTWGVSHLVHLGVMDRVCRRWEISGVSCKHAMAAIIYGRKNMEDYVHPYFSKEMYLEAYAAMIHPILDHSMWRMCPGDLLDPLPLRRMAGKPRKNRKRQEDEGPAATSRSKRSQTLKCTWCQQFGHNKRTCQRGLIRDRGRGRGPGNGRGAGSGRGSVFVSATSGRGSVSVTAASGRGSSSGSISVSGMGSSMARGRGRSMSRGKGRANNSGRGRSSNNARGMGNNTSSGRNVGDNEGTPMPSQCVTQDNQWASF